MRLVIIDGLDSVVEATRELKNASRIDVCVEIVRNALKKSMFRVSREGFKFSFVCQDYQREIRIFKIHKDYTTRDWERMVFSDETRINYLCSNGISWCWIHDKKNLPAHVVE